MSKRKDQFDLIETYWDVKMTEKDFKIEKIKI